MDEHRSLRQENRAHWDELAEHHPHTDHYDVEAFLGGESTIRQLEREELEVSDHRLLHLQCHFGLDTLSWVRNEGAAHATGVDFSGTAIETARELRDEIGLSRTSARFVESDVYDIPERIDDTFDVVVTTYGTIYWLPHLEPWAAVIADRLEPGGTFYIADSHPFVGVFHHESTGEHLQLAHPYFNEEPLTEEFDGSYAGWNFGLEHQRSHGFGHALEEVVTSLAMAGLRIDFLHEHPWCFFQRFEAMVETAPGRWVLPDVPYELPLTFSLQATKHA